MATVTVVPGGLWLTDLAASADFQLWTSIQGISGLSDDQLIDRLIALTTTAGQEIPLASFQSDIYGQAYVQTNPGAGSPDIVYVLWSVPLPSTMSRSTAVAVGSATAPAGSSLPPVPGGLTLYEGQRQITAELPEAVSYPSNIPTLVRRCIEHREALPFVTGAFARFVVNSGGDRTDGTIYETGPPEFGTVQRDVTVQPGMTITKVAVSATSGNPTLTVEDDQPPTWASLYGTPANPLSAFAAILFENGSRFVFPADTLDSVDDANHRIRWVDDRTATWTTLPVLSPVTGLLTGTAKPTSAQGVENNAYVQNLRVLWRKTQGPPTQDFTLPAGTYVMVNQGNQRIEWSSGLHVLVDSGLVDDGGTAYLSTVILTRNLPLVSISLRFAATSDTSDSGSTSGQDLTDEFETGWRLTVSYSGSTWRFDAAEFDADTTEPYTFSKTSFAPTDLDAKMRAAIEAIQANSGAELTLTTTAGTGTVVAWRRVEGFDFGSGTRRIRVYTNANPLVSEHNTDDVAIRYVAADMHALMWRKDALDGATRNANWQAALNAIDAAGDKAALLLASGTGLPDLPEYSTVMVPASDNQETVADLDGESVHSFVYRLRNAAGLGPPVRTFAFANLSDGPDQRTPEIAVGRQQVSVEWIGTDRNQAPRDTGGIGNERITEFKVEFRHQEFDAEGNAEGHETIVADFTGDHAMIPLPQADMEGQFRIVTVAEDNKITAGPDIDMRSSRGRSGVVVPSGAVSGGEGTLE